MEDNLYEAIKAELDQEVQGKEKWLKEIKDTVSEVSQQLELIADHSKSNK